MTSAGHRLQGVSRALKPWAGRASPFVLVAVAAAVLAANVWLPVWSVPRPDAEAIELYRHDLVSRPGTWYETVTVQAPVVAAGLVAAASAAMATALWSAAGSRRAQMGRLATAATLAAAGFAIGLSALRWFGFYLARTLDSGPVGLRIGLLPVANVVVGAVLFAACRAWWPPGVRSERIRASHLGLAAASCLAVMALLPVARAISGAGLAFHYDELSLAVVASAGDGPAAEAAGAAVATRLLVGGAALVSLGLLCMDAVVDVAARRHAWIRTAAFATAAALAANALVFFLVLVARLGQLDGSPGPWVGVLAVVPLALLCAGTWIATWHAWRGVPARRGPTWAPADEPGPAAASGDGR